jgi:crotonobetainyl-CoA:carnitine CoA-transferase CaiB-like acyl-CoA transferase
MHPILPDYIRRVGITWRGPDGILPAVLPVADLARLSVGECAAAAAGWAGVDGDVVIDTARVATAFTSERHLRIGGRPWTPFAPLSRFWRAADGWVRTHANYPHHRARLLAALGTDEDGVGAAIRARPAAETERAVYAAGGLAVAANPPPAKATPPGRIVTITKHPAAADRPTDRPPRVLDLTRVIAGPVATRTLALFGADVLRVDSPTMPEIPEQHADTGFGKRSTLLDLRDRDDREVFDGLLETADVLVTGYRPGALDRLGLSPDEVRAANPGLVVARLSAWGDDRRGFDSLVQATSGIALTEGEPGVLPAQALDHATGYLVAAAILDALHDRPHHTWTVDATLDAAARWLLAAPRTDAEPADPEPTTTTTDGLTHALPAFTLPGGPSTWDSPPTPWGSDQPQWRDT